MAHPLPLTLSEGLTPVPGLGWHHAIPAGHKLSIPLRETQGGEIPAFWCHRPLPRPAQPRNGGAKHLTRHWTRRWKTRRRIRQLSRGRPPKRNTIERTTIMVVGGSLSDFSLGASYANKAMSASGTKQTLTPTLRMSALRGKADTPALAI